jgi:hypothetical protein
MALDCLDGVFIADAFGEQIETVFMSVVAEL